MQTLTLSPVSHGILTYRLITQGDKEWLVVKGIPIVEGVLNRRFVAKDEFGAFVKDWDGVPIVIRHPKTNNGSARVPNPDVLTIGRFYNASIDEKGKRLVGEFWLDKSLLLSDPDGVALLDQIYHNRPVEVSTGYFSASHKEPGQHNGKDYDLVDRNIHPDHIALLPDEIGACSIEDGCGLNRNHAGGCECSHKSSSSLPAEIQSVWDEAYKANLNDTGDEELASVHAWRTVKKKHKKKDGKWMKYNEIVTYSPSNASELVRDILAVFNASQEYEELRVKFDGSIESFKAAGLITCGVVYRTQGNTEIQLGVTRTSTAGNRDQYAAEWALMDVLRGNLWSTTYDGVQFEKADSGLEISYPDGSVFKVDIQVKEVVEYDSSVDMPPDEVQAYAALFVLANSQE